MDVGQAVVGLTQVLRAVGPARERLRLAEVEQQPWPLRGRRRLLQRALQIAHRAVDGAAGHRRGARVVQQFRHLGVAAPRRVHQLAGDLVQRRADPAQHAGRARVQQLALAERQALVDGVAHQRVHEARRRLRAQDLGPRERGHRARHVRLLEAGDAGHRGQVRALAEHGHGAGDRGGLAGKLREPQQHGAGDRARTDRAHHVGVRGIRLDRVGLERVHELADEQRVATRGLVAGLAERAVGLGAEPAGDEPPDGLLRQRAGPDVRGRGIVGDLGQQRRVGRRVAGPHGGADEDRLALQPAHEVGQEAQARAVAPVQVVDLEQQRALGGEVERQPVEPVQGGERRVPGRRPVVRGGEDDARGGGRARERVRVGDDGLEQLAHDAERELALELAGAGVEHERVLGARAAPELRQQPRLADPGRALDQDRAPLALRRLLEQRVEQGDLAVALDQRGGGLRLAAAGAAGAGGGLVAQELGVQGDERRAGRAPELLAQQHADVLVDAQGLVDVAAGAQDLHQRGPRGLAERLRLYGGAGGLLGLGPGRGAELGADDRERLERLHAQVGELAAAGVDPGRFEARAVARARRCRRPPCAAWKSYFSRARLTSWGAISQSIQVSGGRISCSSERPSSTPGPSALRRRLSGAASSDS